MPAWSVPRIHFARLPAHAVVADQRVLDRAVERVAHVQRAGDVRRRDRDRVVLVRRARRARGGTARSPASARRCAARPRRARSACGPAGRHRGRSVVRVVAAAMAQRLEARGRPASPQLRGDAVRDLAPARWAEVARPAHGEPRSASARARWATQRATVSAGRSPPSRGISRRLDAGSLESATASGDREPRAWPALVERHRHARRQLAGPTTTRRA